MGLGVEGWRGAGGGMHAYGGLVACMRFAKTVLCGGVGADFKIAVR